MRPAHLTAILATVVVVAASLLAPPPAGVVESPSEIDPRLLPASRSVPDDSYSNVLREDYVGPDACAECHKTQHRHWLEHPHRCMNQLPSSESVKGDFHDARLQLADTETRFDSDGDTKYWMTIFRDEAVYRRYEVTRTVGSRFMQFYVGRQLEGPEPSDHAIYGEHMLPFAYWFKLRRWLPREYFDPNGPEQLADGQPLFEAINREPDVRSYTAVCMNCHNTLPYAYRIFHRNYAGFLGATVAAAIQPLSLAVSESIGVKPTIEDFVALNARLDPDQDLVTMGISCESCHFGGREHAIEHRKIRFVPSSPHLEVTSYRQDPPVSDSRHNPRTVLGICVQCHSGSGDYYANGVSKGNSREAIDMHLGACTSQLRCVDCHEPHTASGITFGVDKPAHLELCVRCHSQYADKAQAVAHSGHAASANVNCLDCHMPRYTQGLDNLVRTHRIGPPVEETMVASGSLNACNLCHLDKSTRWTIDRLRDGWNRDIRVDPSWPIAHFLDVPVGDLWLDSSDAALRLVAGQSYADSPLGQYKIDAIRRSLNDTQPINRVFGGMALSRILSRPAHEPLEVEITASPATRARQILESAN